MKAFITQIFVLVIVPLTVTAQLTGTKTIPGDYPGIQSAISDLNSQGVGEGGVVFEVAPGHQETFSGSTAGLITASGTSSRPIVFKKSDAAGANPLITAFSPGTSTTVDGIIIISGGDYITFDGIDLVENASNNTAAKMMEWGYAMVKRQASIPVDGCQHVTIRNCSISLNKLNNRSAAIYSGNHIFSNTTQLTLSATTDAMNHAKIYSNTISNVFTGIYLRGYSQPYPGPYTLYDYYNEIGVEGGNSISDFGGSAGGASYYSYGIYTALQEHVRVANNTITGGAGSVRYVYGVYLGSSYNASAEVSFNDITLSSANNSIYPIVGIYVGYGGYQSSNTISIHDNKIHGCSFTALSHSGDFTGISQLSHTTYAEFYRNEIFDNQISGTGNFYGIEANDDLTDQVIIYENAIYNNSKTGAYGNFYALFARTSAVSVHDNEIYNNSIPNATGTSYASNIYGYYDYESPVTEEYYNNQFYDLHVTGSSIQPGNIYGIYSKSGGASVKKISNNQMHGFLVSTGGGGFTTGIKSFGGNLVTIQNNCIYDLETDTTIAMSYGIHFQSGSSVTISNNMISDLRAPQSDQGAAIQGIKVEGGSAGIFNNTIFINGSSSTNTRFGTAGIVTHTGAVSDLRNNIVVNLSTPVHITGNAYCTAFQRTTTNLANYSLNSNNNCFYCGEPDSWHLVYYDGTNTDSTLQQFKSRVFPRDTLSFSENVPFMNNVYAPYDLHVHANTYTRCESGGQVISAVLIDIDGDPRYPNTGYPEDPLFPATAPDVGADEFAGIPMNRTLALLVFLEGLFNGMSLMNPASDENGPVWGADIADHIMVELHESFPPYSQAGVYEAVLHTNGVAVMNLDASCNGEYYIVIKHRNSLETGSSVPVAVDETVTSYNFIEGVSQAYGSNMLEAGLYSLIYGGDVNQDDIVDSGDMIPVDNLSSAFTTGYLPEDANGDGLVDSGDMILLDNNSGNFITIQRPE